MTTPCIEFQGARTIEGYGKQGRAGKVYRAHRLALADHLGVAVEELQGCVCHRCDNPACINPEHLFLGSHAANMHDMAVKGRQAHGSRHWCAKLTQAQVQEVRQRYRAGGESLRDLARVFGVSHVSICKIVQHKAWRHVA